MKASPVTVVLNTEKYTVVVSERQAQCLHDSIQKQIEHLKECLHRCRGDRVEAYQVREQIVTLQTLLGKIEPIVFG